MDSRNTQSILGIVTVALYWALCLSIALRRNSGNRLIACGYMTFATLFVTVGASKVPGVPDWIVGLLALLTFVLALLTLGVFIRRLIQESRGRRSS
jgi:heme A synthase